MSFRLPLANSPLRELFDVRDLLPYGEPGGLLKAPTLRQALNAARATLAADSAIRSINSICLMADGSLCLLRVKAASSKILWNFSK